MLTITFCFLFFAEISYSLARTLGAEERPGCRPVTLRVWKHHPGSALPPAPRRRISSPYCPEDEA